MEKTKVSYDRTQETSHRMYYIKRLTTNHSLLVIRDKYSNEMFFSGKVNHHRFEILINGQVMKGQLKETKKDREMINAIIAETEDSITETPKYAGQCLVCEHFCDGICKIGKLRLFSIRLGFDKCDKKTPAWMSGIEIETDSHGATNDTYVNSDKVHVANGFKFAYNDVFVTGEGVAQLDVTVLEVDADIMACYFSPTKRLDYFIDMIAEHYMTALSEGQQNMTPDEYLG